MNIKCRSWSETDKRFYYFLNGGYFNSDGKVIKRWRFDWENAEQYTGLKDSEGKEIYEGDIVEEGIVFFSNEHLGFFVKLFEKEFETDDKPLYDIPIPEVIGTIHENPELLEEL